MTTHAKARFLRRIENRKAAKLGSDAPNHGKLIPGELTATELAKKERRHNRRIVLLKRKEVDALNEEKNAIELSLNAERALKSPTTLKENVPMIKATILRLEQVAELAVEASTKARAQLQRLTGAVAA